jgi:hypothetical protein
MLLSIGADFHVREDLHFLFRLDRNSTIPAKMRIIVDSDQEISDLPGS